MNKILTVTKWEYIEKVKSKAFIISLFLTPAIMAFFAIMPNLFANKPDTDTKIIGIIDQSRVMTQPLSKIFETKYKLKSGQPNYLIRAIPFDNGFDAAKATADSLVLAEKMEGYIVVNLTVLTDTVVQYRSENMGDFRIPDRFTSAIHDVIQQIKLEQRGLDPSIIKDLKINLDMKTFKVVKKGEKEEEGGFGKVFGMAYGFMMVMFLVVITTGQLLVRSMLEEKSNRIIEVLVSSCSATELMSGKILGLSALGLTQLFVWGSLATVIAGPIIATIFTPLTAMLFLIYFILGYLLYASIFVAFGAPVSTEQEAQQITSYLVMTLLIPVALVIPVIQSPDSLMARVLSFIPLLTPTMMVMRMAVRIPNILEIIATIILLGVSAWGMMRAAGKIFRTTILLTGKRPGLRELIAIARTR